jgi:hypothetical protein
MFRLARQAALDGSGQSYADRWNTVMSRELDVLSRFVNTLGWITDHDPDIGHLPETAHIATAQHYGLPTHFLDFSVDPLIATWFACHGSKEQDLAAVCWAPFGGNPFNFSVVLAPPWVRRVHRQKGVFLDCLRNMREICENPGWHRIVFPASPEYCASFDEVEPMYPENAWFEAAVAWAPREAGNSQEGRVLAERLIDQSGWPPFIVDAMIPDRWRPWIDSFVEFCEWLAIRPVDGRYDLDCQPVREILKDNPHLESALRHGRQFSAAFKADPSAYGGHLDRINECLDLE